MSHQVLYAYHVTGCTEREPQPNWSQLSTTTEIDGYYNGYMQNLISKGVFFSTTLRDDGLPKKTLYPRNGERDVNYWRAFVPLSRFKHYKIIRCHSVGTGNNVEQVAMLLVPPKDSVLKKKVEQAIQQQPDVYELTGTLNKYLYRNELTKEWRSNNFNDLRAWVNIVVPHDVPLGKDTSWDLVEHM